MADDKLKFELDIDSAEFIQKILEAKGVVADLGGSNLEGLIGGLKSAGLALGALGAAAYAIKGTFETVFAAEEVKAINAQFETLGRMAGIATDTLSEGLIKAADGLIDDTDLLKEANEAIVQMGKSAEKLPQVLELARKASSVMGTDFKQTFENLNQAIATGQTRALKNIGINIDAEKAVKAFAQANNIAANEISQAGKQQAILNAVLEQGGQRFKDVDVNLKKATDTWTQLKVTVGQVGEALTVAFEKTAGPAVQGFLGNLAELAKWGKENILAKFGSGQEQASAKINILNRDLIRLQAELQKIDESASFRKKHGMNFDIMTEAAARTTKEIEKLKAEITALEAKAESKKTEKGGEAGGTAGESGVQADIVDQSKRKENAAKFNSDLIALRQSRVQTEMQLAKSYADYEDALEEQKKLTVQKAEAEKAKIKADANLTQQQQAQLIVETETNLQIQLAQMDEQARQRALQTHNDLLQRRQSELSARMSVAMSEQEVEALKDQQLQVMEQQHQDAIRVIRENSNMTEEQKLAAMTSAEQQYQAQRLQSVWNTENERMAALENSARHADSTYQRMSAGAELASMRASQSFKNHEQRVNAVMGSVSNHMATAFESMANGSANAGEAMKKMIMGVLADRAIAEGSIMMLSGIWPPNPVALGAGAALVALGGTLRGMASGKSKMSSGLADMTTPNVSESGGGSGGGGGGGSYGGSSLNVGGGGGRISTPEIKSFERQQKVVSLNIQGNYFETEQTKIRLVEMIRESSDATDFNIKQIGES